MGTRGGGAESASERESGYGSPLRAVYITDHQWDSRTIEQRGQQPVPTERGDPLMLWTYVAQPKAQESQPF